VATLESSEISQSGPVLPRPLRGGCHNRYIWGLNEESTRQTPREGAVDFRFSTAGEQGRRRQGRQKPFLWEVSGQQSEMCESRAGGGQTGGEVEPAATRWIAAGRADAGSGARRRREERGRRRRGELQPSSCKLRRLNHEAMSESRANEACVRLKRQL
jgi:hypothetical protein